MHAIFRLWEPVKETPRTVLLIIAVLAGFAAAPALAASGDSSQMEWWNMGMKLFGGLALFLFGMEQMADALKAVAGERMKIILARLTTNRFMGAMTGAFVTAVIQSSSVTTVLVVGFITAGLMSMAQSIGIIMGANIGTTITAQIIAFKVTKAALLMVAVGFGISDGPTAAQVAEVSDAVVVGSALINRIVERLDDNAGIAAHVGDLARTMRTAMDANTVDGTN